MEKDSTWGTDLYKNHISISFATRSLFCLVLFFTSEFIYYYKILEFNIWIIRSIFIIEIFLFGPYYILVNRFPKRYVFYNYLCILIDIISITIALHYMGGINSLILQVIYLFIIGATSIFFYKLGCYLVATTCFFAYSILYITEYAGLIPKHNIFNIKLTGGQYLFIWLSMTFLIYLTAFLSSSFFEILRKSKKYADMGRFLTQIAHEIRNPIGIIDNEIKALNHVPGFDSRVIKEQTSRIASFINEILAYSRDEEVFCTNIKLNDVIDLSLNYVVKAIHKTKKINIIKEYCSDELPIKGNLSQLQKAFINILKNAVDSMDGGGTLTIGMSRHSVSWASVKITDTGKGIAPEDFAKIFEPFYTKKSGKRGIGLGLAIAKKFIDSHEGIIEVDSRYGCGSTFTVKIPLIADQE